MLHFLCVSATQHIERLPPLVSISKTSGVFDATYLVEVDSGLPELLLGLVEVPHTDLTEVTGVVLVQVGAVVVLTTGHTATTGALAVLADTTVTGGHMATAMRKPLSVDIDESGLGDDAQSYRSCCRSRP